MKNTENKKYRNVLKFLKTFDKEMKTGLNTLLILLAIKQKKSANGYDIVEITTK